MNPQQNEQITNPSTSDMLCVNEAMEGIQCSTTAANLPNVQTVLSDSTENIVTVSIPSDKSVRFNPTVSGMYYMRFSLQVPNPDGGAGQQHLPLKTLKSMCMPNVNLALGSGAAADVVVKFQQILSSMQLFGSNDKGDAPTQMGLVRITV